MKSGICAEILFALSGLYSVLLTMETLYFPKPQIQDFDLDLHLGSKDLLNASVIKFCLEPGTVSLQPLTGRLI